MENKQEPRRVIVEIPVLWKLFIVLSWVAAAFIAFVVLAQLFIL